ncbi:transposase [Streptomyces hirsutus]|uniref:transposase n=1 Tax=Streptomyces hirsutus TaxID=35620 RepID=UPI0036D14924
MARPSKCNAEFRSDAVALWRAAAGRRTFKDVAADLNVNPETLRTWVRDAEASTAPGRGTEAEGVQAELVRLRSARRGSRHARPSGSEYRSWPTPHAPATCFLPPPSTRKQRPSSGPPHAGAAPPAALIPASPGRPQPTVAAGLGRAHSAPAAARASPCP